MTPDLQSLLERVKGAEGPSKHLSRDVQCQVGGWYRRTPSEGRTRHPTFIHPDDCRDGRPVYDSLHGTDIYHEPPDVTESLDAALALVERVLPLARVMVERFGAGAGWAMVQPVAAERSMSEGNTPALALLAAMLRALLTSKITEGNPDE